jgi:AcrR family transcriptional regulator
VVHGREQAARKRGGGRAAPQLREQARELYRDAILSAAELVFTRCGFAGTRMAEVAAEAGLATGTLYNYFANRDELLSSLIDRRTEELLVSVKAEAAAAAGRPPRDLLVAVIGASFQHFEQHHALFAVLPAAAGISGVHMASIARRCMESHRSYQALIADALRPAVEAGQVRRDVPLSVLVGFLTGAVHGVMRAWTLHAGAADGVGPGEPQTQPLVEQASDVVDLFLRGATSRS